jgi:hypothetical protein
MSVLGPHTQKNLLDDAAGLEANRDHVHASLAAPHWIFRRRIPNLCHQCACLSNSYS